MIQKIRKGLVTLMVLALTVVGTPAALAAEVDTDSTTASITFTDGVLQFADDLAGSGMNLDFGSHILPIGEMEYEAENQGAAANHIVKVEDARFTSGDWLVTVALSSFAGTASSFDGVITLSNAVLANDNAAAGTTGITVGNPMSVASGASAQVITADGTAQRGAVSATWTNEDVVLSISDAETLNLRPEAYTAELTWSLTTGPN